MTKTHPFLFFDALYGDCALPPPLARLVATPIMQRLREIRLSNIDSLSSPGVANISRFEHCLGTARLASSTGFFSSLSATDALVLQAACLLHDSAMQPFGHLVEEALKYLMVNVPHEDRWRVLASGGQAGVGGIDHFQIYMGLEAGLMPWAYNEFGDDAINSLQLILDAIAGDGRLRHAVSGSVDLDNLDNVVRAAHHMGIPVDRTLPLRIAEGMLSIDVTGVTFAEHAVELLQEWLDVRAQVYDRFMLSSADFAGKLMLISATTEAFGCGCLDKDDWALTDREYLDRLLGCSERNVVSPIRRWLTGDLWDVSELFWMQGQAPLYPMVFEFSKVISERVGRSCLAYRIKDKRTRNLQVRVTSRGVVALGSASTNWLLGVGSPRRDAFTSEENRRISTAAQDFFGAECIGTKASEKPVRVQSTSFDLFQPA